jgi:hypothetical protein
MADKAISELTAAEQVTPTDLFVLDQDGVAKKLTGQILKEWLRSIYKEDIDSLNGVYDLDLRGVVEVATNGENETEQVFYITDNVDLDGLIQAIEAGKTIRVFYTAKVEILDVTRYDVSVDLTEAVIGDGWILSGIGLDRLHDISNEFDFHFTKLYVGADSCRLGFTPASLSAELDKMVKSVNGAKPDVNGNVELDVGGGATVDEVLDAIPTVTDVAVTENADGSVTMVNTLSDGSTETIVVTADANGNPNGLTVNGTAIPVTWTEVTA